MEQDKMKENELSDERVTLLLRKVEAILKGSCECDEQAEELLWQAFRVYEGDCFLTSKKLEYTYKIRGNEMFVSRKEKSITRATAVLAFKKAMQIRREVGIVKGPKKLGTFGASYLYPIFQKLGII